ncbi:MAG: hypothetical protein KatS3mg118_1429 [Paracoccaceae bacterium]|nr:MAG: hypothetical protein KatS3mg118_1429 [Paracoccaceae bacterium]
MSSAAESGRARPRHRPPRRARHPPARAPPFGCRAGSGGRTLPQLLARQCPQTSVPNGRRCRSKRGRALALAGPGARRCGPPPARAAAGLSALGLGRGEVLMPSSPRTARRPCIAQLAARCRSAPSPSRSIPTPAADELAHVARPCRARQWCSARIRSRSTRSSRACLRRPRSVASSSWTGAASGTTPSPGLIADRDLRKAGTEHESDAWVDAEIARGRQDGRRRLLLHLGHHRATQGGNAVARLRARQRLPSDGRARCPARRQLPLVHLAGLGSRTVLRHCPAAARTHGRPLCREARDDPARPARDRAAVPHVHAAPVGDAGLRRRGADDGCPGPGAERLFALGAPPGSRRARRGRGRRDRQRLVVLAPGRPAGAQGGPRPARADPRPRRAVGRLGAVGRDLRAASAPSASRSATSTAPPSSA